MLTVSIGRKIINKMIIHVYFSPVFLIYARKKCEKICATVGHGHHPISGPYPRHRARLPCNAYGYCCAYSAQITCGLCTWGAAPGSVLLRFQRAWFMWVWPRAPWACAA